MESLLKDIRYALRNLANAPGFTFVAVLTLALGIGATTAMFSLVNAVLLRPLPFAEPDRLVAIGDYDTRRERVSDQLGSPSYPNIFDVRDRNRSFEGIATYHDNTYTMTGVGQPLHVSVENVSANLFQLLRIRPSVGRDFLASEDKPGNHVVILNNSFWRTHFNSDPNIAGRTIVLSGHSYTIVGVMPKGFQFPVRPEAVDMWETIARDSETDDPKDTPWTGQRGNHSIEAIARLKPGVTLLQANDDLSSIAASLRKEYPKYNDHLGIGTMQELRYLIGDTRDPLLILLGAVALVLLIACANVANLLLARGSARTQEIAVRSALGATRVRIVRQLVTESMVLGLVGAALGILVAHWALASVLQLYPSNLPRAQEVGIDLRVLVFTIFLALITGLLFGLIPALRVSAPNLTNSLREGGRTSTTGLGHNRLRTGLVIAETALGVMLLVGAGLLIRSLQRLSNTDIGFNPSHLLTANFDLSETQYKADNMDVFIRDLVERLRALPGVKGAGGAVPLPLNNDNYTVSFNLVDHRVADGLEPSAGFYVVTSGFFETMQIPVLRGRAFNELDARNGPPSMIITESFAKKYFPNEDPIGRKIEIGAGEGAARRSYKTREIVGVVGDIRASNLTKEPRPSYYIPLPQLMWGPPTLVIRTENAPGTIANDVRKILSSMDADAPLYSVKTMDEYFALALGRARFQTLLLAIFAGTALVLTAVGLYGVMAFAVLQRTHEIGVRIALGASRSDVLGMVLKRGVAMILAGIGIGLLGAIALSRLIQSLLYQIPPRDPATYFVVCIVLACVALFATYVPALRATRVDPMVALRYE